MWLLEMPMQSLKNQVWVMMTSSNGNISTSLVFCAGNSPATGEFPAQRPVTRSFDVLFDLCLNKRWSTQWWDWWFETPSCSLWRQRNVCVKLVNTVALNGMHIRSKQANTKTKPHTHTCTYISIPFGECWYMWGENIWMLRKQQSNTKPCGYCIGHDVALI